MPRTYLDEETHEYKGDNLYFVEEEESGHIKIGRGRDAFARLSSLQVGNPRKLTLLDEFDNLGWQEDFWHVCWAALRVRGEWFKGAPELRAAIAEVRKGGDWTDHTFVLTEFECDVGEWQEHMLDAMEFYEQIVLDDECSMMSAEKAALMGIFDPDFDGRCISTRFMDAVNAARQRVNNVL